MVDFELSSEMVRLQLEQDPLDCEQATVEAGSLTRRLWQWGGPEWRELRRRKAAPSWKMVI